MIKKKSVLTPFDSFYHHDHQAGFSLFETLLAILLFAVMMIGLLDFQSILTADLHRAQSKHQAEQAAFQLLETYPTKIKVNLAHEWQYQVTEQQYNVSCKIVTIKMTSVYGEKVTQTRWYCH